MERWDGMGVYMESWGYSEMKINNKYK
jgi:hypothetical protein